MDTKTGHLTSDEIVAMSREHVFFSWSVQKNVKPIPVAGGQGIYFWDVDGKRYMDFSAQLMNLNIGYQHPKVVAAIKEQAGTLTAAHPSMATEPKALLAKMLAEIAPGDLNKVFYTLGGAEANENAIKFARFYTGRHKLLARYISYHGATYGAITLSGDYRRPPAEPGIPGVVHVLDPYCYRCPFGQTPETCHLECIKHVEQIIQYEGPETVAALFLEGVTGSNGVIVPPDDYWPRMREITKKYGILLVSDEVMSGFGRTGEWFAVDNWDVVPDLITFAKGVTSGYLPLGGVIVSQPIADHFQDKLLYMGLTYFGHPMSAAAGVATVNVYKEEDLIRHSKSLGKVLGEALEGIKSRHCSVGDVRYIGLFSVLELVKDRETKERMDPAVMSEISARLLAEGLSTYVSKNMIFVVPPLVISETELLDGLAIIERSLSIADAASTPA
jgi:taurine--2-oxoglutarate transaminase